MHPLRDGHTISVTADAVPNKPPERKFATGQQFVPYRQFQTGLYLPEPILRSRSLSQGAKLLWGRLAKYAGPDGRCFPLLSTLATDLGCSERQVQRYVAELINSRLLAAEQRGFNKSNHYTFLWHPVLDEATPKKPARTTSTSSCSTTSMSSCVRTTSTSSHENVLKLSAEMQASTEGYASPNAQGPACTSLEEANPHPLNSEEASARGELRTFQEQLNIAGTIMPSTVRAVLSLVPRQELVSALKYVAEKIEDRRHKDPMYRRRVEFGFVLTILRQDWTRRQGNGPARLVGNQSRRRPDTQKQPEEPPQSGQPNPPAMSAPPLVRRRRLAASPARRGGLCSVGSLLQQSGLLGDSSPAPVQAAATDQRPIQEEK